MSTKDLLSKILADLQQLSQELGDVDNLKEAKARAQADLDDVNARLQRTKNEMNEASAGLNQVQRDAQRRFEQDMFTKQGELRNLTDRVKSLEERAKELSTEVIEGESRLKAVSISMEDARRKLAS